MGSSLIFGAFQALREHLTRDSRGFMGEFNKLRRDIDAALSAAERGWGGIIFGSGDDGAAVFDGTNTFTSFASKNGSTYTLTRDTYLADGSIIQPGVTLNTAGFRLFCNGKLTVSSTAVLACDGKDASLNVAGGSSALGTLGIGMAGGAGHVGIGTGTNGTNQSNTLGDAAGAGGNGGAGGVDAGGTGGTYTPNTTNGGSDWLLPIHSGFTFIQTSGGNQAQILPMGGGAGGGGGGSDNAGVNGGGGGGGGGVMVLIVFNLVNNGTIRCKGGKGGNAAGAGGNGGGGGGGGGGIINNLYRYKSGTGSMSCPGGTGGTHVGASGVDGSPGQVGHVNAYAA